MRIAVLEDEPSQMELLSHWLRLAGHQTSGFERAADLLHALEHESFDALLIDWNLSEVSGIEVLREVRERLRSSVPVIFSTARDHEDDVVSALKAGADDYLAKPLRRMELLARLETVTRRGRQPQLEGEVFEVGVFRVDCQTRSITRDNQPLELTTKDFDLAALLLSNVGRLLSRGHLLQAIWGQRVVRSSRTLDTHVSRVRNKLRLMPEYGWRLAAVYGYGYRLNHLTASASRPHEDEPKAS